MKMKIQQMFAVVGIAINLASASSARVIDSSPSDSVLESQKQVSTEQAIAPSATNYQGLTAASHGSLVTCCDQCSECCDNCRSGGCSGLLSRLLGEKAGCDDCKLSCDSSSGGLWAGLRGCDSGCDACGSPSLFGYGIIKPGEKCFDDFIGPTSNPVFLRTRGR